MNKTIKYTVPTYALSSMVNGDISGLEDREVEAIDSFEAEISRMSRKLGAGSWSYDFSNESYFSHTNDVDSFGNDCVDCAVHFFALLA